MGVVLVEWDPNLLESPRPGFAPGPFWAPQTIDPQLSLLSNGARAKFGE